MLVTGAGRGIGRAITLAFATRGERVAVLARSETELAATVAAIESAGGEGLAVTADVTDHQAVLRAHQEVVRTLGAVEVLVNNAGVGGPIGALWELDATDWRQTIDVNLNGTFNCTQAVLPSMIERRAGHIVNIASQAGAHRWPLVSAYATAKAAIIKLTENVAAETHRYGVSVFAIHPGTVHVGPTEALLAADVPDGSPAAKVKAWFRERIDAGHAVAPETSAKLVTVLASGRADALSGRYISVDDDIEQLIARAEHIRRLDLHVLKLARDRQ